MTRFIKHICILILFLGISQLMYSQGKTIIEVEGKKYYQHIVEAGNTLYAIAKYYQVDEEVIIRYNPGSELGLQLDQTLMIPIEEEDQGDKWTNPIRIEGNFLIHRVKRKETLYGISKEYQVEINDVLSLNPKAENGLSKGMELKIPSNDVDVRTLSEELTEITVFDSTLYIVHEVKQGETFYYLSKYYDVEIDAIKRINGGMSDGLKLGSTILIRLKTDSELVVKKEPREGELFITRNEKGEKTVTKVEMPMDGDIILDSYGIAVFVPLYMEESLGGSLPRKESKLQEIAYHFYEGVKMAVDSLKDYGLNAQVFVIDVNGNDKSLEEVFNSPEMQNVQLVIGPFQKSQVIEASRLCLERGIHMVVPVSQSNKILIDQPNVSKAHPSYYTQMEMLALDVIQNHKDDNIILFNSMGTKDALMVKAFKSSFENGLAELSPRPINTLQEVKSSVKNVGNINALLKYGVTNVIVVPSKDKIAVQDIFTQLTRSQDNKYMVKVYGIEEWWDYKFIDFDSKKRFHLTIATPSYIDYSNSEISNFVKNFKNELSIEPNKYAFSGYDIMTYYGKGLLQFGRAFPAYFDQIDQSGLLLKKFNYFQPDEQTGYENRHIYILETTENRITERSLD